MKKDNNKEKSMKNKGKLVNKRERKNLLKREKDT